LSGFVYVNCSWFDFDGLFGEIFTFVPLPFIDLEAMKLFLYTRIRYPIVLEF